MEFGIINFVNALIVVFILIPNIIYAMKGGEDHKADNGVVTFLEQVGRYASIAMMILPLGVWKFGFPNVLALLVYLAGDMVLLIGYWIAWGSYIKKKTYSKKKNLGIPKFFFVILLGRSQQLLVRLEQTLHTKLKRDLCYPSCLP